MDNTRGCICAIYNIRGNFNGSGLCKKTGIEGQRKLFDVYSLSLGGRWRKKVSKSSSQGGRKQFDIRLFIQWQSLILDWVYRWCNLECAICQLNLGIAQNLTQFWDCCALLGFRKCTAQLQDCQFLDYTCTIASLKICKWHAISLVGWAENEQFVDLLHMVSWFQKWTSRLCNWSIMRRGNTLNYMGTNSYWDVHVLIFHRATVQYIYI